MRVRTVFFVSPLPFSCRRRQLRRANISRRVYRYPHRERRVRRACCRLSILFCYCYATFHKGAVEQAATTHCPTSQDQDFPDNVPNEELRSRPRKYRHRGTGDGGEREIKFGMRMQRWSSTTHGSLIMFVPLRSRGLSRFTLFAYSRGGKVERHNFYFFSPSKGKKPYIFFSETVLASKAVPTLFVFSALFFFPVARIRST